VALTSVALLAVAVDQASKLLIPDHLYLQVAGNPLGPLGSLELLPPSWRAVFFAVVTGAFVVFVVVLVVRLGPAQRAQVRPLALLLGGVLSNGLDRLVRGQVIDCVLLRLTPGVLQIWLNLADVAIVAALAWLIWLHRGAPKVAV